jgi:hypothetical protein
LTVTTSPLVVPANSHCPVGENMRLLYERLTLPGTTCRGSRVPLKGSRAHRVMELSVAVASR